MAEGEPVLGGATRRHVYETQWPAFALAWANCHEPRIRLAVGSYTEQETNSIQILELRDNKLELAGEVEHPFPPTKLMWKPDDGELLASSSTSMNLWKCEGDQVKQVAKLTNSRTRSAAGQQPPITSFDWSSASGDKIGTSSVDTTCTIWNVEKQKIETQLIAHDKAVYDIAFATNNSLFTSVGADGSVRVFDQRNLEHSTIIYETTPHSPLLRVAWNKHNLNHIATIAMDTCGVILIDIRRPNYALKELWKPSSCVNAIAWAPHTRNHLLCGASDGTAFIWDVTEDKTQASGADGTVQREPLLAYECDHEVYQVQWPASQPEYVALGSAKQIEVLQI